VWPMVAVMIAAIWRLPKAKRWQAAGRAVAMVLLALLFAKLASLFYTSTRPFKMMGLEPGAHYLDNPGFPSDHATVAFGLAIIVWMVTKNTTLTAMMLSAAVVVAWARVAALVHTPLDVAAGAMCAALAGICMYSSALFKRKT
jgi:membrane-associated phospholipid phosphatase